MFKIKRDLKGNVERYKTCFITDGFTQIEGIDYKETFSLVFIKHSLKIIMALAVHFDLNLYQMDVKLSLIHI